MERHRPRFSSLSLVILALVWASASGCARPITGFDTCFEWNVRLTSTAEEVQPPQEPVWMRADAAGASWSAETTGRLAPRPKWQPVHDGDVQPFRCGNARGTEYARAVATDGVRADSRSSAIASATKRRTHIDQFSILNIFNNADCVENASLSLEARSMRGRFQHRLEAEAIAYLNFEVAQNKPIFLRCRVHTSGANSAPSPAGPALSPAGEPLSAGPLRQPPADASSAVLVISLDPRLEEQSEIRWQAAPDDAPTKGQRLIAVYSVQQSGPGTDRRGAPVQCFVECATVQNLPLYLCNGDEFEIAICNEGEDDTKVPLRGYVGFTLMAACDWDAGHDLFPPLAA